MARHLQSTKRGAVAPTFLIWLTFLLFNVFFWQYADNFFHSEFTWRRQMALAEDPPTATATATATATQTYTPTATATATATATQTYTPTVTPTATVTATATQTYTPTVTPTATVTDTPTVTPTNTPLQDGAPCTDSIDCQSDNCVDDVCCNDECDGPNEICNLQGSVGTCTDIMAAAPATSRSGLLIGLGVLTAIAAIALWRRRELTHYLWSV